MLGLDAVLLCPEYGLSMKHTAGMFFMNRSLLTRHLDQLESFSNSQLSSSCKCSRVTWYI